MSALSAAQNPFRSERIDALDYRLQGESWERALDRLDALGYRASVVGPRGHGKTTLLDALARRLAERGHDVVRARVERTAAPWSRREARDPQRLGVTGARRRSRRAR